MPPSPPPSSPHQHRSPLPEQPEQAPAQTHTPSVGEGEGKTDMNTSDAIKGVEVVPQAPRNAIIYAVIALFLILNMAFSLINKWLFSHLLFQFPILLVSCNLFATSVVLWLSILLWSGVTGVVKQWKTFIKDWKLIASVAFFTGTDLVFENSSLVAVPVSLNQVIKAFGPVLLVIMSRILEKKKYSWAVYISSTILALGTFLAVYENPEGTAWGVFAATMSAFLSVAKTIAAAVVLEKEEVSPLGLAVSTSLPSVLFVFPFYFMFEQDAFLDYWSQWPTIVIFSLIGTSLLAVVYNWLHFKLVGVVGSIASGVVGVIKLPVLVFLSIMLWNNVLTWYNWVGMILACVGFAFYQYFRPIGKSMEPKVRDSKEDERPNAATYELLNVNIEMEDEDEEEV